MDPERVAGQEHIFRSVNESIERGQWPGEEDERVNFRCECARLGCNELVPLSRREYEWVREHPRWFVMIPGHELPEVETIVESREGYVIVEKRGEAGQLSEASDPGT